MTDPRLYTDTRLQAGTVFDIDDDKAHYLRHVLRKAAGDRVILFNGQDGEWQAHIQVLTKKAVSIEVETPLRPQAAVPDLWLVFAPLKQDRLHFVIEKATELGVQSLQPVMTERGQVHRLNADKLRLQSIEAAEQTERLDLPEIRPMISLRQLLADWPVDRPLYACVEAGVAKPLAEVLSVKHKQGAILIGPEGGFSASELSLLSGHAAVIPVSLGPRILRAETAAIAALSVWQSLCGDWTADRPAFRG